MRQKFTKIKPKLLKKKTFLFLLGGVLILLLFFIALFSFAKLLATEREREDILKKFESNQVELERVKSEDQFVRNEKLEEEIKSISDAFVASLATYEKFLDFKDKSENLDEIEEIFADILAALSKRDYKLAEENSLKLSQRIDEEDVKIATSLVVPESVVTNNEAPGSGYSRQNVNVSGLGVYLVSLVASDLGNTRVIVDTASESSCSDNCPVLPLATYVSRNGAFAGINGTYFCPASYPTCAGKSNTFDLLVMNKNKTYFNSDNNVYSNNPAVIFGDGYIRFVSAVSQWGRDTSPNGVLSNFPLLVLNSQITFGGDDDPKKGSRGGRSFVASRGNTIYIGVVHNATVAESARVLHAMGMENALNLDDGGSTALWSGGYKVGPGRDLPNVILFVRK